MLWVSRRSHTADNVASTQETITTYDSRGNVGIIVIINTGCCGYPDGHTLLTMWHQHRRPLLRMIVGGNVGIIVIINTGCCGYPDGHTLLTMWHQHRRPLLRMITEVMWVLLS